MSESTGGPGVQQNNIFGLLSLIIGIASIPLVLCFGLGLPAGLAAVVLGIMGKRRAEDGEASNRGQAIAGMICGAAGAILALVAIFFPDTSTLTT